MAFEHLAVPYEIDSAAATVTFAVPAGRSFYVYDLWLQVEANATVQFRSGATDISGPLDLLLAGGLYHFTNAPFPVLRSRAPGDDFIIANPGTVQMNGTVTIAEGDPV